MSSCDNKWVQPFRSVLFDIYFVRYVYNYVVETGLQVNFNQKIRKTRNDIKPCQNIFNYRLVEDLPLGVV